MSFPVVQIAAAIQNAGGEIPLGKLSQAFPGVKKAQIETQFCCIAKPGGGPGDMIVTMSNESWGAVASQPSQPFGPSPTLGVNGVSGVKRHANKGSGNKGSGKGVIAAIGGAVRGGAVGAFGAFGGGKAGFGGSKAGFGATKVGGGARGGGGGGGGALPEVSAALAANGGCMSLGLLTRGCPGIKKAVIAKHFTIAMQPDGQAMVSNGPPGVIGGSGEASTKKKKTRNTSVTWEGTGAERKCVKNADVQPLDMSQVSAVRDYVIQNGGIISLGKLCRDFQGVKRSQLEEHFSVSQKEPGNPNSLLVSL